MKTLPPRDRRGRFTKAKPKAPVDPKLVAELGQGRSVVDWTLSHRWEVVISKRWATYGDEKLDITPPGEAT